MIEKAIADTLSAIPEIAVYPVVLPRSPSYPSVTYHRRNYEITSDNQWSMNSLSVATAEGAVSLFQIVIYAETYTECSELLRSVKSALETVSGMTLDSVQDGYEWKQNVFAVITEWNVWGDLEERQPDNILPITDCVAPIADAILSSFASEFDEKVKTVRFLDPRNRSLETPALILDIDRVSPGGDADNLLRSIVMNLSVYCLYPYSGGMMSGVISMAADVMNHLRYNLWGMERLTDYPTSIVASREPIRPGVYSQWVVKWEQSFYICDEMDDDICHNVDDYSSFDPQIGEEHEDAYVPIVESDCNE